MHNARATENCSGEYSRYRSRLGAFQLTKHWERGAKVSDREKKRNQVPRNHNATGQNTTSVRWLLSVPRWYSGEANFPRLALP